ncbi:SDR family NAD(P)-dependent oxidoreductase [Chryseobacterium sp. Ch-15]|uniref:SDR family NAD(P)-dependent oxidoreductase n=1 Tax=Chryseobacterium muglaense TaxID=2893752 RepID=A0A9Q3UY73_9FLAO|nr:SDR family NAD(P)-dependent oxidoreductase [Chryseobacterium muglaense]MBD3903286.1 SDR family NAD(P)-dependent oxidoreductase [Chryseobacterium muglaense]MCC9036116.1 SDR family NAD(P)-dependent oxidoreductase [Chryseobacterium muglaense]MCM2553308.1 SDR family NAD(P)-dependent oxidoreductase [Chryseobacterium muglaense]
MNIKGKTILITGGASGIGLEAAKQFLENGANVIITGRNQAKLNAAKEIYPNLIAIKSDVANEDDAISLFNRVKELGGIDILYNNAGVGVSPLNLGIASEKHHDGAAYEMNVNYLGVIRLNNLFLEMLKARNETAIINTTSILSIVPSLVEATYSASKTALAFYTKSLREHLQIINSKVKVFEVLPPLVATEMTASRSDKKMTTEAFVKGLIAGLKKDQYTIRVGDSKLVYMLNRFFPKLTFGLINPKKDRESLKS